MNKPALILGSAVLIGCVLAGEMLLRRGRPTPEPAAHPAAPELATAPATPSAPAPRIEAPVAVEPSAPAETATPAATADKEPPPAPKAEPTPPPARTAARRPPVVVPDAPPPIIPHDVARTALAYVGTDPDAEAVWATAINDPSLSAHARSDLIEDLNEDGFPDPHHVTPDDLPLIVSRLALIEELAPDAMDQVNADAFAEAYKDLANMYVRLTGGQ